MHVLVVEDEPDLRAGLVELLSLWGYDVDSARNGREAVAWLRQGQEPVLVLLDLQMPVMNGDEVLAEMSRQPPRRQLRIIVLSANRDVQSRHGVRHVVAALDKPVRPERLHAAVEASAL
jgi:two-component system chemotaxis response regulator CheY